MNILVTGGAGFIGSAVIRHLIADTDHEVLNVDKLTYAGNLSSLEVVANSPRYHFQQIDICDAPAITDAIQTFAPHAIMHLAAESHVDRSIDGPATFLETNVVGTYTMLEAARHYWMSLPKTEDEQSSAPRPPASGIQPPSSDLRPLASDFRFLHISTDEVYGSLGETGHFTETTPYDPRSPYSASKAASDHFVQAWWHTYGLPILMTNCSNNYGPYHFPEKLIPLVILNALDKKPLPIYGKGDNVRDWLYVDDHARALCQVLEKGRPGEKYNIGGNNELTNLQVVENICDILDELAPLATRHSPHATYRDLITFVTDRPGHDKRYAIDASKLKQELCWTPANTFESGIRNTIQWYLDNAWWWMPIREGKYTGERLGIGK